MNLPRIGPRETVYKNRYQHIYRVKAHFDGYSKEYFVNDFGPKAGIVVVRENNVLLVRQYRLLINGLSWEIPGGKVDEGESPQAGAVRECLEETGVRCIDAHPLVFFEEDLDTMINPTHIFYSNHVAEELEPQNVHTEEVSGSEWVPISRCIDMIGEKKILDNFSIMGLLAYSTFVAGP